MRLHRLSVTAFGPFPGTEEIDFDELNDAGLFLLTGPTGAGKSSLLDAICFALYGQVPGVRGVKTLKSQHAADDVRPEVLLDFSIRSRRFVVRRSPEWTRPKRRGVGVVNEKPKVTLVETTEGADHFLGSTAQEVGHLVSELVGMHASQFQQVAMLPQGEFQRFLQASSQDRHDVLERLFKTDRFSRIEDWVYDHSRDLRARSGDGSGTVQRILDTMADRARVELPDELSGAALASTASSALVVSWAEQVLEDAESALAESTRAHDAARTQLTSAVDEHDRATRLTALVRRRDEARQCQDTLAEAQPAEDAAVSALDADARASRCAPVIVLLDAATRDRDRAQSDAQQAQAKLALLQDVGVELPESSSRSALDEVDRRVRERITRITSLLPTEIALLERHQALEVSAGDLAVRAAAIQTHGDRQRQIPDERAALTTELDEATQTSRRGEMLSAGLATARARLAAARLVPARTDELARLREVQRNARDAAADARQRMQDVVAARLSGIAAELAGRLEAGLPCQVCGSADHPSPAAPTTGAVSEADQDRATSAFDRLSEEHTAVTRRAVEAQRVLDAVLQASDGLAEAALASEVFDLEAALAAAERAALLCGRVREQLTALDRESSDLTARLRRLETEAATLTEAAKGHREAIDQMSAEIANVLGDEDEVHGLGDLVTALSSVLDTLDQVGDALTATEQAEQRSLALAAQADATAHEHGFTSTETARAALLEPADREALTRLVAQRSDTRVRARLMLEDPDVVAVADQPTPDLGSSLAALGSCRDAAAGTARGLHVQEQLVDSLLTNLGRLRDAMTAWSPVRERYMRAEAMSKLVRGMGSENHLQMRLSAYVLATRLDQVIDAANERLAHMRDQRYLLQRTGKAARKDSQAGLGLQVVDEWTGDVRDPATLSGGETFVVSLSLALGLADVVTQEAGGTEIETLFVDEGFGMLDADTLDDVMDRLDGLRAGGRTVGVVSHVTEIRNRIPTQVHVEKQRTGSTVAVRTMVA